IISEQTNGLLKLAVPTATALAPASKYSITSSAEVIPPIPIIGIFTTSLTSYIILIEIGFIAGSERPPVRLAINGRLLGKCICIPVYVLIYVSPSASALSTALAISTRLVTLGDN